MADLHFCENCDSLLEYSNGENNTIQLVCSYCERTSQPTDLFVKLVSKSQSKSVLDSSMCYDSTLRETNYFECSNTYCPSNREGKLPLAGMFNYTNPNRQLGLICKHCGDISLLSK